MEFEESIFNLIPKEAYVPPKQPRHKSKHDPKAIPTASTFALRTTSKPGVSNLAGHLEGETNTHSQKAMAATIGLPKGQAKPNSQQFRLKGTGTFQLPEGKLKIRSDSFDLATKFNRDQVKKVPVPKRDEKPIMGLVSDKNFIVSNAVENILAAPNLPVNKEKDFLKKKNYGKVPKYLQRIKNEIEDEFQLVREMQIEEEAEMDRQKFLMDETEK
jgi:hypothetical protein